MQVYKAGSNGVRLEHAEQPTVSAGQVLIDVHAIALNRGECRRAVHGGFAEGYIAGWDSAGRVSQVGPGVEQFKVGDRVVARGLSGGWAEYRLAHQDDVAIVPEDVDLAAAATLATAATTALAVLTRQGSLLGRTVAITGATGSVGQYAIQLAKLGGATVHAIARSQGDHATLRALGADAVFSDIAQAPPADLILETLGGTSLAEALGKLKPAGFVQIIGWSAGEDAVITNLDALMKSAGSLQGFAVGEQRVGKLLDTLVALLQQGKIKASIQLRQPWAALPDAAAQVLQPGFHGKAVVELPR